jgi:metal transporter CNNM
MAPAPKARVPKGQVVAENDGAKINEGDLMDLRGDHSGPEEPLLRHGSQGNGHSDDRQQKRGSVTEHGSPKRTVTLRRTSSVSGSAPNAVTYNNPEMREHLKHLGPSNLASRPKSTRYNTVKIKPAAVSSQPLVATLRDFHVLPESPPHGGTGAGTINSGGKDAKDGVHALHTGYGSMERSSPSSRAETSSKAVQTPRDGPDTNGSMRQDQNQMDLSQEWNPRIGSPNALELPRRNTTSRSANLDGRPSGIARSGSITENVIDAGGIRKVVLEMTSSSDDGNSAKDGQAEGLSDVPESRDSTEDPKKQGKKKRRRRKRNNDGKASEDSPLLSGDR